MTTLLPGAREVLTHGLLDRPRSTAFLASSAAATITDGLDVLVHEVIEAIATAPWSSSVSVPSASVTATLRLGRSPPPPDGSGSSPCGWGESAVGGSLAGKLSPRVWSPSWWSTYSGRTERKDDLASTSAIRSWGRFGPGDAGHDRRQVELDRLGVLRLTAGVVPEPLLLGIGLDERDLLGRPPGQREVVEGDLVDREDRAGRAELRAHVADRGPVGQRHRAHTFAVELDELADHAELAEHLGDGEHDVGSRCASRDLAAQLEADDLGDEHRDRLPEHRRLGLDAADAPAQDTEAVDHRGVRVGARPACPGRPEGHRRPRGS